MGNCDGAGSFPWKMAINVGGDEFPFSVLLEDDGHGSLTGKDFKGVDDKPMPDAALRSGKCSASPVASPTGFTLSVMSLDFTRITIGDEKLDFIIIGIVTRKTGKEEAKYRGGYVVTSVHRLADPGDTGGGGGSQGPALITAESRATAEPGETGPGSGGQGPTHHLSGSEEGN